MVDSSRFERISACWGTTTQPNQREEIMNQEKKNTQKNGSVLISTLLLLLAVLPCAHRAFAQSQNTPHTLGLDRPKNMPAATINDMVWIVGHFQGEALGGIFEEVWAPPFGGAMMGMFKVVKDDTVVFYELLTIIEESNSLNLKLKHFNADLTGWEEKDEFQSFPLVKLTQDAAFFDGITFRKLDQDTIQVFVAIQQSDDETQEIEFKYHRVKSEGVMGDN